MNKPGNTTTMVHPEVWISATDFGPIASGVVDLRPLTVFVGPSNIGKTYFAILIYALRRILNGFPQLPVMYDRRYHFGQDLRHDKLSVADTDVREEEIQDILEKLDTEGRPFRLSDLPMSVHERLVILVTQLDSKVRFGPMGGLLLRKSVPQAKLIERRVKASTWSLNVQIVGPIPSELGNLSKLEQLNLSWNQLSGAIPAELGNLSNLRGLNLSRNESLTGALPQSLVGLRWLARFRFQATGLCAPLVSRARRSRDGLVQHSVACNPSIGC